MTESVLGEPAMRPGFERTAHVARAVLALALIGWASGLSAAEPKGLKLHFYLDRPAYTLGEPAFAAVTLSNRGAEAVWAHLPKKEWDSFELEVAFGKGRFQRVGFRLVASLRTPMPKRQFKPGEVLGASAAILLRPGAWRARRADAVEADVSRWLFFGRPGTYRVRAFAGVNLGDKGIRLESNVVRLKVTPAAKGYKEFVRFAAKHFRAESMRLGEKGYEAGHALIATLENTPYQRHLIWSMMRYSGSMLAAHDVEYLAKDEKARRKRWKAFAEQTVLATRQPWSMYGEEALVYLVLYHYRASELETALKYANLIRQRLPWSRYAGAAANLAKALERQRATTRPASRAAAQ